MDQEEFSQEPTSQVTTGTVSANKVKSLYDKGSDAIRGAQLLYQVNQAYLAGQQWVYVDTQRNRVQPMPRNNEDRVRISDNRLRPESVRLMAKLLRRELSFQVPPKGADDATIRAARIAEAVLSDIHREHNWEGKREEHAWQTWNGGTGVICVDWDASAGTQLGYTESGKAVGIGGIKETVLGISQIATEPGVANIEYAKWWIKAQALPPEEVKDTFKLAKTPAADITQAVVPFFRQINYSARDGKIPELTLVLTYYERPSENSDGLVETVVGGKIVDGPNPWPFPFKHCLNLVVAKQVPIPNQWFGETLLTDAVQLQTAYNQSWSSIIEHMKNAGNARLMVPDGSLDLMDEWSDTPGEVVAYRPESVPGGGKPDYLSPPVMPQWWIEQPQMIKNDLDDILGVHDVSRGDAPPNVESGLGLSILAEADETPIGGFARELGNAWGRYASKVLEILAANVTEERTARVEYPDNQPAEMVEWNGKSFMGQTTAIVPADAVSPISRSAQKAMGLQLYNAGVFGQPSTPQASRALSRYIEEAGETNFIEATDQDVAKARRENHLMALGEIIIPAPFDNHVTHIEEHNIFRKSARYDRMSQQQRDVIDTHIQAHETLAAESLGQQAAMAQFHPALALSPKANQPFGSARPGETPTPQQLQLLQGNLANTEEGMNGQAEAPAQTSDQQNSGSSATYPGSQEQSQPQQ